MRILAAAFLILFVFYCTAAAEIPCMCDEDPCICFIQQGDEGMAVEAIQNALVAQGYLAANDDAAIFDEKTLLAVLAFQQEKGLSPTGILDDTTLTLLLWGALPEEVDALYPDSISDPVWIPTDGGIRHHKRGTCCEMYDPRLVSHRNALKMDMQKCGLCKPTGYNTEFNYFNMGR